MIAQQPPLPPAQRSRMEVAKQLRELIAEFDATPADEGDITTISSVADAASLFQAMLCGLDHEELHVMLLDTKHHVMCIHQLYVGTLDATSIRPAELFREAIKENAAAIIIAHNHPSGDPEPSMADLQMTTLVARAGRMLDLPVLDHLIVGKWRYHSLAQSNPVVFR